MVGITSYGAYIPLWRISRDTIAKEWGAGKGVGEKAVANFDEDSLTMAVAAAIDCLKGQDRRQIDGAFFASTTSPYKERQEAVTMAAATDLRKDIITSDFTDSLRAGTQALRAAIDAVKADSAKRVLVSVADARLGAPRSQFEQLFGDAAAAFVIGDSDVVAEIQGFHSIYHEISDFWRSDKDTFVSAWEDRFVQEEGYMKAISEALTECMKKYKCKPKDFAKVIAYAPDARRHAELAKALGIDPTTQLEDGLFDTVGLSGCAASLLMLVGALEKAKAGDRLLLISYGDGVDIFLLQVTENIEKVRERRGVKSHLSSKKMVPDYASFAQWKGTVSAEAGARRPPMSPPSSSALWRERDQIYRLYGVKCKGCGTIQYPPQRVCTTCQVKDNFEKVRLSDKRASLFTYSLDYIAGTMDVPLAVCVINFDGGGRLLCTMTDRDIKEIKVGLPLEMTFRKLFTLQGVHNYFWKCMPVRS